MSCIDFTYCAPDCLSFNDECPIGCLYLKSAPRLVPPSKTHHGHEVTGLCGADLVAEDESLAVPIDAAEILAVLRTRGFHLNYQ